MMGHDFIFNEISTDDYGIYAFPSSENKKPAERDYTTVEVPGRDGSLTVDNKRYKNKPLQYTCILMHNKGNYMEFMHRLSASVGFFRLEDSAEVDTFYKARYNGAEIVVDDGDAIKFTISFDAKPQTYLKAGENVIALTQSASIYNPTYFASKPLLRIYGMGTVHIGDYSVTIQSADGYTDIDCESLNAYKGDVNCNGNVILSNNEYPQIQTGDVNIVLDGIPRIEIIPRWYTT